MSMNPFNWLDVSAAKVATNESKNLFANERTFIHWVHMSVVMGSIATGLLTFSKKQKDQRQADVVEVMAALLIVTAISFITYALGMFVWRRQVIALKLGNGEAGGGPIALASVFAVCLLCIFVMGVVQVKE